MLHRAQASVSASKCARCSTRRREVVSSSRASLRPLRPKLHLIFLDPFSSLNPRMTPLDIVCELRLINGIGSRQERIDRVAELLRLVGLRPEYMRRFPHALSGGKR